MNRRSKRLVAGAAVVALLALGAFAAIFTSSAGAVAPLTGSIVKVHSHGDCAPGTTNPCWTCTFPVDLDKVEITIDENQFGIEAVRLGSGCTGRIGQIVVKTEGGEGIKVVSGAHDLVVGGGSVTCAPIPPHTTVSVTDQYGIRAFGGYRVTFAGMYVNCQSTSSRFEFFVNKTGTQVSGYPSLPTDVLFVQGCLSSGPRKTALVGTSDHSGIATSTVYPFTPGPASGPTYDIPANPSGGGAPAVSPLNHGNVFPAGQGTCSGPNG